MTDIRMKAWNKKHKEFEDESVTSLYVGLNGEVMATDGDNQWHNLEDDIILLRHIGMQDLHGIDIYEGDTLRLVDFEQNQGFEGEVVFHNGAFCLKFEVAGQDKKLILAYEAQRDVTLEVIGNLYQNEKQKN